MVIADRMQWEVCGGWGWGVGLPAEYRIPRACLTRDLLREPVPARQRAMLLLLAVGGQQWWWSSHRV